MNWQNRTYFGTWQFGGDFYKWSNRKIERLISYALTCGIKNFDTAAVYGGGNVEKILGYILPIDTVIVTKIAASSKPTLLSNDSIDKYYSKDSIQKSVEKSLKRLKRKAIDTILLHNWIPAWNSKGLDVLEIMNDLKKSGLVRRIGISLPDGFGMKLSMSVVRHIDVIESPFNLCDHWILSQLPILRQTGKEILLRSLFVQGLLVKDQNERCRLSPYDYRQEKVDKIPIGIKYSPYDLIHQAWALNTSVVIGMTTKEQIKENLKILKEE